ncbi:MAG: HdeA/HdeB family chaperone [Pseudorhodoplanes sp.]
MFRTLIASAIAISALAATPAKAQVVLDMTMLTCKQYLEADKDRQDLIAAWMSGYYNAARNNPVFNASLFQQNRNRVSAYCKKHRPETLMSAIQRSAK